MDVHDPPDLEGVNLDRGLDDLDRRLDDLDRLLAKMLDIHPSQEKNQDAFNQRDLPRDRDHKLFIVNEPVFYTFHTHRCHYDIRYNSSLNTTCRPYSRLSLRL